MRDNALFPSTLTLTERDNTFSPSSLARAVRDGGAGEERGQFRRTEVRRNGGQRIRPGLFGAQADTARHPSGLPRVSIGKKEFTRLRWVSRPTLKVLGPVGQVLRLPGPFLYGDRYSLFRLVISNLNKYLPPQKEVDNPSSY